MRDFNIDEGMASVDYEEKGIQLAQEACQLCGMGGLRLHKFVSNNKAVSESIPPSERAIDIMAMDLSLTDQHLDT